MRPVSVLSPADRACRAFMRAGLLIALIAFLVVGGDVLLAQWIIGSASLEFVLGTAALIAGLCLGLFAVIAAIGLVVAAVLRKAEMHRSSPEMEQGLGENPEPGLR
jgi:hypothetical protein